MKKVFLSAIIGFCLSPAIFATPAQVPTEAEHAKAEQSKMQAKPEALAAKEINKADPNMADYKKAGLTDHQITELSKAVNQVDQKKADIQNNDQLTAEQKQNAMQAIETERNAVIMKQMGEEKYKKYSAAQLNEMKKKPDQKQ